MLNISEELKSIYNNDILPLTSVNATKDLVIYFPVLDLTIETDQIVDDSFSLEEKLCSDTDLVFGACESSMIKFTLADVAEDLTGQEFAIIQIVNGNTVPLGIYTVDSCKKQDDLRFKDIVAYDRMRKADIDVSSWYNSLTFPLALAAFKASLLSYLGIEEELKTLPNDSMLVAKTIEPSKLKGRDVLISCEEINGCFGHINRYGRFAHIVLEPSYGLYPTVTLLPADDLFPVSETDTTYFQEGSESAQINTAMCESVRFEEYTVKEIDKLQIRQEEGDIGAIAGTGTNAYVIEGNFLAYGKSAAELNTIAVNAFGNMQKRPYKPFESNNIGLPYIEVGDTIAFNLTDVIAGYVFKRTLTGMQALRDTFTAEGNEEREQNFSVNKEIIQLQGRSAILKRTVDELSSTLTDTAEGLQSQITQTAGQLQVQITDTKNNLQSQITQQAGQIELKVDASGVIAAINISPGSIKISADKLELSGYATFTSLATPGATTINGANLQTGTVTADVVRSSWVYAGSISADQITAGTLSGITLNGVTINSSYESYFTSVIVKGTSSATTYITGPLIETNSITVNTINGGTPITTNNRNTQITSLYSGGDAQVTSNGSNFRPHSNYGDNSVSCGSPSYRWTQVYAATSTISTSDKNMKQQISSITEAEKRVAQRIKQLFVSFKFNAAVDKKGDNARIHIGVIAQDVQDAFEAEGLDPYQYALFCSDTWYEKDGKAVDENENPYTKDVEGVAEVTRLSLRYEELYGFIFAAS